MTKARDIASATTPNANAALLATFPHRNLIINGAMQVAQRGTSGTLAATNNFLVDRFLGSRLGGLADIFDTAQVSDAPDDFTYSYKLTQDGTSVTLSGTNACMFQYRPEGQDFAHLNWGTSSAKSVTLSFYVKSSVTGTLAVTSASSNSDQDIAKEYTINSANTWERKTLTIPGPTSGTWGTGTSAFGYFTWGICGVLGSARETSNIDAWGTGSGGSSVTVTANSTNALATTSGATWQITGIQLEVGDTATPFEHRSYGEELALCQRYYEAIPAIKNLTIARYSASSGNAQTFFKSTQTMRSAPSVTVTGTFTSGAGWTGTPTVSNSYINGFTIVGATSRAAGYVEFLQSTDTPFTLDAEL